MYVFWIHPRYDAALGLAFLIFATRASDKAGITPPSFPSISLDFLPFNQIRFDLPSIPSMEMDFAGNAIKRLTSSMKLPLDMGVCGTDISCLVEKSGIGSIDDTISDMIDVLPLSTIEQVSSTLQGMVTDMGCAEWKERNIPVSSTTYCGLVVCIMITVQFNTILAFLFRSQI